MDFHSVHFVARETISDRFAAWAYLTGTVGIAKFGPELGSSGQFSEQGRIQTEFEGGQLGEGAPKTQWKVKS